MRISDEAAADALLRQNFSLFLRFAFGEVGGGRAYQHNWHIDAIEHQLDRVRDGTNRRLIVTMPPRHLKSVTISSAWVAWMLGRDPAKRFICASYGYELSEKHARDCLRIMTTDWYCRAFPKLRLTRRSVLDFETSAGGGRFSTSVGGVVTGRGGDIIIIDDPMKADEALSEARRDEVREWFFTSIQSRLDDQTKSSIILVMQRLHESDLAGELLRRGGWEELRLPAIATHDELIPLTQGRVHQRREGYVLHSARTPLATLNEISAQDPYVFAAQHQQDPVGRIGAFVMPEWFSVYDEPPRAGVVVQSWDTAVKTTVRSDWSVGITAIYYMGRFYIIDVFRKRVEFGELKRSVRALCQQHRVSRLLIEDAASGAQLIQQLREEPQPDVTLPLAIRPTTDKIARFEASASRIEAGTVVLPRVVPWLGTFITEVTKFPNGRHDDQADALTQMLANPPIQITTVLAGPELVDPFAEERIECDEAIDPWGAY